ncbi:MAG: ABC transporter substrate-binding protein [Gemmatimonadales bacterium]
MVTLLPGATEIVAALGGGAMLAAVSHECDYPDWVADLPRVTGTPIDPTLPGATIDTEVRRLRDGGRAVITVDGEALQRLEPDLVIAQDLCEVCAVADGTVHRLAAVLPRPPEILTLTGRTLDGVLEDIRRVARVLGREARGEALVGELRDRLASLRGRHANRRPRILCVEWLEPLFLAGHWVPDLVEAAGGINVAARSGDHSRVTSWEAATALRPDLVVVMLCGFGVTRARAELDRLDVSACPEVWGAGPVWLLDGNAYTSRPSPRIVDGAERIQSAIAGESQPGLERWQPRT